MKKRQINPILYIVVIALALSALVSCSKADADAENETETETDTVVFIDALGREVSVGKNPKRVAALLGSFAEIWQLAGGSLCASAEDAWEDFGLEMGDAISIGGAHSPSLEVLLSSSPDFVLASASTASNVEFCDTLDSMGITVAYFDIDNFEDYLAMLKICTDITLRADLYEKNGLELKERIEEIKKKYAEADISDGERRVLLLRASSGFVKAKGSEGTVLGEMLADIGCVNIADSDKTILEDLSVESVIASEPYHIFVVAMGDADKARASLEKMMQENPAWSTLDAVKNGRLHVMDKRLFNLKPNARYAEAYEVLYETLTK